MLVSVAKSKNTFPIFAIRNYLTVSFLLGRETNLRDDATNFLFRSLNEVTSMKKNGYRF